MKFYLAFFLISTFVLKNGFAIKCYVCDSITNVNCVYSGFNADKVEPVDCQTELTNITSCILSHTRANQIEFTQRMCGTPLPVVTGQNSCIKVSEGPTEGTLCECNTDLCNGNGAAANFIKFGLLMMAIVGVWLVK